MMISKNAMNKKISVKVSDTILEQVKQFKYLGTKITHNAKSEDEIKCRINLTKANFCMMNEVLTSR